MDPTRQQGSDGREDYLDKGKPWPPLILLHPTHHQLTLTPSGLDAAENKFGQGKVDPNKQRGMNEKVTDGVRGAFEKATG